MTTRCAGCHVAGSSFATQSELVLTPDVAYPQLAGVPPHNSAALADGLVRVSTRGGLQGLADSYLWEKINVAEQAHFLGDHPNYGSLMPLGEPPLTNGQLEYVRQWILQGAPASGEVSDRAALQDTTRYVPPAFQPLAPPANGIQLHLGPFEVAPHYERELFSYRNIATSTDRLVKRVEISMRPGSHHFVMYEFRDNTPPRVIPPADVIRDLRDAGGRYIPTTLAAMPYHDFFSGTQWSFMSYTFPPGVALRLPAGKGLDMNSHYVNRTDQPITAEVFANVHFADPTQVQHVAEILYLTNENFQLPPHQVTTIEKSFAFPAAVHIFQLFSHAHEHLQRFEVVVAGGPRAGELVYAARDWQHPPILQLDPPLVLAAGQGLELVATYDNQTDRDLGYGLLSTDEMMILFGYAWTDTGTPAVARALP